MAFTTRLFKALGSTDMVACDHRPIATSHFGLDSQMRELVELHPMRGPIVACVDQDIEVGPGGMAKVVDIDGVEHVLRLTVHTGLQECHLASNALPDDTHQLPHCNHLH